MSASAPPATAVGATTRTLDGVDAGCTLLPPEGGRNDPGSVPWKSPAMRAVAEIFARAAVHRDAGVGGLAAAFLALSSRSRRAASLACRMKSRSSSSSSSASPAARSREPRRVGSDPALSGRNNVDIRSAWFSKPFTRTSLGLARGRPARALAAGERPMPIFPPRGAIVAGEPEVWRRAESTGPWWCYKKAGSEGRRFSWLRLVSYGFELRKCTKHSNRKTCACNGK